MNKNKSIEKFDILVIGGGHAGIEASLISSKLKHKVALITLDKKKIGFMPCNPSVGGVAKGIVVREIDALGGEIGYATDTTALQFKLLNTSGGPAVQALRVQSDKIAYSYHMQKTIEKQENLTIIENAVKKLLIEKEEVKGAELHNGKKILARTVIITTGTYLQPITYKGSESKIEGPDGEKKVVNSISQQLQELGFKMKRFKTGTSPRVLRDSIDFSKLKVEAGTDLPLCFSARSNTDDLLPFSEQLPCYLLYTNEKVHQIIRDNFHLSPIFYKKDIGTGPRYCPSIEDKIFRFADKERHQIFLEPEARELDTIYIQGLSTSLPVKVQAEILKNLLGLEKAEVKKWGYAIEYDVVDSTQLKISLESKLINGLFTAGQINGTTGYEEAAAQGIIAGINASRKLRKQKPLILGRDQAYIGVLIEDLVTKEITDPYRLLTSRAEYRLLLRHDNAETRLYPIAKELELLSEQQWKDFQTKQELQKSITYQLKKLKLPINDKLLEFFPDLNFSLIGKNVKKIDGYNLLKLSKIKLRQFNSWIPEISKLTWKAQRELEVNIKYEDYIHQQKNEVQSLKEYEKKIIPSHIDYFQVDNLSKEAREKLSKIKPNTLGHARRTIAGINPTDILVLNHYLNKHEE